MCEVTEGRSFQKEGTRGVWEKRKRMGRGAGWGGGRYGGGRLWGAENRDASALLQGFK